MYISYIIKENDIFENVKDVLKRYFKISDRLLTKLKNTNNIFLNDKPCSIKESIKSNDTISFSLDFDEDNSNIVPTKIDLNIIYEDEFYLVVDKPANIAIHPSVLHYDNSLSNGIKYYFDSIGLKKKIRPVNRLDRDTSGIVIFAKNEYVQECLIKQMTSNKFHKEYVGIVEGQFNDKSGTINLPIARKENSIIERCIDKEKGSLSVTHYETIDSNSDYSIIKFILETGRTHQIRVHCSSLGHPIVGDTLYGTSSKFIDRQALHSYKVNFIHPITHNKVEYISESYKTYFKELLDLIQKNR